MNKKRKFSVGYNGTSDFLKVVEPYSDSIENIYFGLPSILPAHHNTYIFSPDENTKEMLMTDVPYKRIMAFNHMIMPYDERTLLSNLKENVFPFLIKYKIDGMIVANYKVAKMLHKVFPDLELHTSCNCYHWTVQEMQRWKDIGISVFNPPREILRLPSRLKEMHNAGFKLKCLVNEGCIFGCPQSVEHQGSMAVCKPPMSESCMLNDWSNVFKSNWVLPRWLKYYDDYVDIYKITSRSCSNEFLNTVLDAYVNERDDINIFDVMFSGSIQKANEVFGNPVLASKEVPDKLAFCEMKECSKCDVCNKLWKKVEENCKCS